LAQRAGHDINYIAYSGALSMIGRDGERPVPPINLVGDFGGGSLFLVAGVLAAIYAARTSGEGQVVDVSMVDGAASLTTMLHGFMNAGFWSTRRGTNLLDGGAPFYDTYETSDARYVAVGAIEPQFYLEFVRGLGLEPSELPAQMDHAHWSELRARFAEIFLTKTRDEWDELFRDTDACVSPVLDLAEARTHPVNHARHVFGPDGTPNPAPRFSATPSSVRQPSRRAGSGTTTALARWGVASTRLDDLAARGAFN
jgi:alpha-methylacyl-CoA racemase